MDIRTKMTGLYISGCTTLILLLTGIAFAVPDPASGHSRNPGESQPPVVHIGSRLELFVDDYLIGRLGGNAKLRLHNPQAEDIAIALDAPWEGSGSGYVSVFHDGERYRMYYKAAQYTVSPGKFKTDDHPYFTGYAESYDGIHWTKPNLGLYEYNGSKANNIVFISGLMDGVNADGAHPAVFKDQNPNVSHDERYKALLIGKKQRGLFAFKSPNGIHWTPMHTDPVITDGAFDSQNLAFWDPHLGEYRAYWRYFTSETAESRYKGIRAIRTAKSKDFLNWYEQKDLTYTDSPLEHLYTNQVKPYHRAPHILIGFPARYVEREWSESMRALPQLEHRELRASASQRYGTALSESLFMASRDGVLFKRWNEAFLRPGIERNGTWAYGNQYLAWTVVETKSPLGEDAPNELSFYSVEDFWTGTSCVLRRYTLRLDGFVSVTAPMSGGELLTKPFTFTGDELMLNFSSSAAGDIRVEILDEKGKTINGYTLDDCIPLFGDTIARPVVWKKGSDLSELEGKTISLRFILRDADLYSFQFK